MFLRRREVDKTNLIRKTDLRICRRKCMPLNYFFFKVKGILLTFTTFQTNQKWIEREKKCSYFFFKYISNSHMNIWRKYLLLDTFTWLRGRCLEYRKVTSLYSKSRGHPSNMWPGLSLLSSWVYLWWTHHFAYLDAIIVKD